MEKTERQQRFPRSGGQVLTAVGAVLCILFGFLLICNLTLIIKGMLCPEKPPSVLGITPMVVLSGSMSGDARDHIEAGDLILVGTAEPEKLEPGDIIAYQSGGSVVTHRITAVGTAEDGSLFFTTKGDANNAEDTQPVSEEQLVGVYLGRAPGMGNLILYLQQPMGMLLFAGIPLSVLLACEAVRRRRDADRERKRTRELEEELERLRILTGEQEAAASDAGDLPR